MNTETEMLLQNEAEEFTLIQRQGLIENGDQVSSETYQ